MFQMKRFFVIFCILVITLCGCNRDKSLENQWIHSTDKLLNVSFYSTGEYSDFNDLFTSKADILETYYLLTILNKYNFDIDNFQKTKDFIVNYASNNDFKDVNELIALFKVRKLINIGIDDLKPKIIHYIDKSIKSLKAADKLSDEIIALFFSLNEFIEFIDDSKKEQLNPVLDKFCKEIIKHKNYLYALNPIYSLSGNKNSLSSLLNKSNMKQKILNRIATLSDVKFVWEVYQLVDISLKLQICNSKDYSKMLSEYDSSIFSNKYPPSNMQTMYIVEILNLIDRESLKKLKNDLVTYIQKCQVLSTGGYIGRTYHQSIPVDSSYFSIYIKRKIGKVVPKITIEYLYTNLLSQIENNNVNWRFVYNFLEWSNSQQKNDMILRKIKQLSNALKVDENSLSQMWFYSIIQKKINTLSEKHLVQIDNVVNDFEKSIDTCEFSKDYVEYYYYSKLISLINKPLSPKVSEKLIKEIMSVKDSKSIFYTQSGYANIITTFYAISIDQNLKLGINKSRKNELLNELYKYRSKYGGYAAVINHEPSLFNSYIGLMLEEIIRENTLQ